MHEQFARALYIDSRAPDRGVERDTAPPRERRDEPPPRPRERERERERERPAANGYRDRDAATPRYLCAVHKCNSLLHFLPSKAQSMCFE